MSRRGYGDGAILEATASLLGRGISDRVKINAITTASSGRKIGAGHEQFRAPSNIVARCRRRSKVAIFLEERYTCTRCELSNRSRGSKMGPILDDENG